MRGDHGTENFFVASRQEDVRGVGRGSYIWGRSVHNIHIERLWVDVTSGFGSKWKEFFRLLELHRGLNTDQDAHIWLLHHLFLAEINADVEAWMATWNNHTLSRRGQHHQSPTVMYAHGTAQHGIQAVFSPEDPQVLSKEEQAVYGINFEALDIPRINRHHQEAARAEGDDDGENPFQTQVPEWMSHIEVPDIRSPLSPDQIVLLDTYLQTLSQSSSQDMVSRAELWTLALQYCSSFY
ncbi:hypothetical protein OF83DRAFT_1072555 [Amylostereum chailletii]|nr:hypothetical protein OF83DRAFT_1072555 [Amylostereum chailletii]